MFVTAKSQFFWFTSCKHTKRRCGKPTRNVDHFPNENQCRRQFSESFCMFTPFGYISKYNPQDPCMLYMVTFTINIPQMLAYIPYMDPMGNHEKNRRFHVPFSPSAAAPCCRSGRRSRPSTRSRCPCRLWPRPPENLKKSGENQGRIWKAIDYIIGRY